MRLQKKPKAFTTLNSRLAHDLLVQTQMCQSAMKGLKKLMKRARIQKETHLCSRTQINKLTITSSYTKADKKATNKQGYKQANPSGAIQNGLHYSEKSHVEPITVLERLFRIGEEVKEVLSRSKSFAMSTNFEPSRRRDRAFSSDMKEDRSQLHDEGKQDSQMKGQCRSLMSISYIEVSDDDSCKGSQGLPNLCINDGLKHEVSQEISTSGHDELEDCTVGDADRHDHSESDDDSLQRLWMEADFYRKCTQSSYERGEGKQKNLKGLEGCNHDFVLKADVGLVCDICGLVEKDIETVFDFTWCNEPVNPEPKRRESNKDRVEKYKEFKGKHSFVIEQPVEVKMHQNFFLDHRWRKAMHEHQVDGFRFLEKNIVQGEHGGCILAHAPGTGKTFIIIVFLQSFLRAYPNHRAMVLAPKGMLLPWVEEFQKWKINIPLLNLYENGNSWLPSTDVNYYGLETYEATTGDQHKVYQLQRLKEWQMTQSILFVSYPHFSYLVNHESGHSLTMETRRLLLEVPGLLILDEGHTSRTSDTVILKSLMHVCTQKRIMLSGTLFQNNFKELFNLCKLVRPTFMHQKLENLKAFLEPMPVQGQQVHAKLMEVKVNDLRQQAVDTLEQRMFVECLGGKLDIGSSEEQNAAVKVLHELMAPFVHWHKGQILDALPGLVDYTVFLHLSSVQEEVFASLESQALKTMEKEKRCALANIHPSLLKRKMHCKQASQARERFDPNAEKMDQNACFLDDDSWSLTTNCDPAHGCKTMFVLDMVALCNQLQEKVLIFSQYLTPLSLFQRLFHKLWGWLENQQILRLDGNISLENRESIISRFNKNKESQVLLASIKACGEGVSLVGASRVIFLDLNWNPAVTLQAISRAFRIGQSRKVFVYRLVGVGTLDEEIERVASRKEWLATVISHASSSMPVTWRSKEVDPRLEDRMFESTDLRRLVAKCCLREHAKWPC